MQFRRIHRLICSKKKVPTQYTTQNLSQGETNCTTEHNPNLRSEGELCRCVRLENQVVLA